MKNDNFMYRGLQDMDRHIIFMYRTKEERICTYKLYIFKGIIQCAGWG